MILRENEEKIAERAAKSDRVLDIGGWVAPFNLATHVIDTMPYATRRIEDAQFHQYPERFKESTWVIHDATSYPWPFPDNYFDFCFCSHLLEDVDDPVTVCKEMLRVCKSGYIETPSRVREIFSKERGLWLRVLFGKRPRIGDEHHLWLVEIEESHIRFIPKTDRQFNKKYVISRQELGRKLTGLESGICLWWDGDFTFESTNELSDSDMLNFKHAALHKLRRDGDNQHVPNKPIRETRKRALMFAVTDKLTRQLAWPKNAHKSIVVGSSSDWLDMPGNTDYCRIQVGTENSWTDDLICIDGQRYRSNFLYRMIVNFRLGRLNSELSTCLEVNPDPVVHYAILAALSGTNKVIALPNMERAFEDDGAYYINRFSASYPRDEVLRVMKEF